MLFSRLNLGWIAAALLAVGLASGCRPQDQIARYTVPKPELVDPTLVAAPTVERQMLGAIVLVEQAGWFFKLTGPKDQVAAVEQPFRDFVKALEFKGTPPQPRWQLPTGWKELPGDRLRFATIELPSEGPPLELTVTMLTNEAASNQEYVLANVNRWREQMQLPALAADELAANTTTMKVGDYEATLVSLVGTGSGGMGPLASGAPFASGGMPTTSAPPGGNTAAPEFTFTEPESWTEAPAKAFSLLTFAVSHEGKSAEITVSSVGGDLHTNINRWRGQVGLAPLAGAELTASLKKIETLGVRADYAELTSPAESQDRTTILGVAAVVEGRQYFIKLTGDPAVAEAEKANFESFVKSLKFKS
jgi:hypothetical protein